MRNPFRSSSLPKSEPDFNPWGGWLMRPIWYRRAHSHILCGYGGAGKTTFLYYGLHDLAEVGVYDSGDLGLLQAPPNNKQTKDCSRFSLQRLGLLNHVDSWIDIDGSLFSKAFGKNGNRKERIRVSLRLRCLILQGIGGFVYRV